MKLNIDGKEYELNTKRAEELGVLKEIKPKIVSVNPGDQFRYKDYEICTVIQLSHEDTPLYVLGGVDNTSHYAFALEPVGMARFVNYLNETGYVKVN